MTRRGHVATVDDKQKIARLAFDRVQPVLLSSAADVSFHFSHTALMSHKGSHGALMLSWNLSLTVYSALFTTLYS